MPAVVRPLPDESPETEETTSAPMKVLRRPRPGRRRRRIAGGIGILAVVLVAVGFTAWSVRGSQAQAQRYSTSEVSKDTIVVTVSASGNMVVGDEKSVAPSVSGTVDDLSVKLGQHVKAGQTLYSISNHSLDTSVIKARVGWRNAKQGLARARMELKKAQQSLGALESREGTRAATEDEIDIARRQVDVAELGVSTAKDDVELSAVESKQAQDDADARTVTAPMDGTITKLTLVEGESASASGGSSSGSGSSSSGQSGSGSSSGASASSGGSSGSLVISDLSSLIARVQVNEVDLPNVKVGQKASLTFDAIEGLQIAGKVTQVAISGTNSQGVVTYDVDIVPTSLDPRVKSNMTVSAAITTNVRPDVLAVPNAAVKSDTNGSYVQVLGTDGTPQRVDVTAGVASDILTEITEGVSLGQSVVTADLSNSSSSSGSNRNPGAGGFGGGGMRMLGGGGR